MSFDEFWDNTLCKKLVDVTEQILSEPEKDSAAIAAKMVFRLLKTALSEYHAFLSSEIPKT